MGKGKATSERGLDYEGTDGVTFGNGGIYRRYLPGRIDLLYRYEG
jgi:hypothetical protein